MATRYWVGGTGTWDSTSTTNWSTTSGGAGGASAPTYADDVIFDTLSNATLYSVTFGQGFTGTGSISGTTLTITAAGTNTLAVGATIYRSSINLTQPTDTIYIRGGTYIVNQLTGTTGGIGTYTVSISQTVTSTSIGTGGSCADLTVAAPLTGAVTFTSASTAPSINIYGSMTLPSANITWSAGAELVFCASATGKTITTNGNGIGANNQKCITFDGIGGGWTLGSALTSLFGSVSSGVRVISGGFTTANYAITSPRLESLGTSTRSISLGSSTVTLSGTTPVNFTSTGLTLTAGTSTISLSAVSFTFTGGGLTFYNVTTTNTGLGTKTFSGANTFNNLSFVNRVAGGEDFVIFSADQTVNGALSLGLGTVSLNVQPRRMFRSDVFGTQRTIALGASATVSTFAQIDFKDIAFTGTPTPISGTNVGSGGNNSGITFTTPKTVYNVVGGNWTNTVWATTPTGSAAIANFPIIHDNAVITDSAIASGGTVTAINNTVFGNVDFSSRTLPINFNLTLTPLFYGALLLSPAVTITGATIRTGTATATTYTISGLASGPGVIVSATADGTLAITGTAVGNAIAVGVAAGSLTITGTSAGTVNIKAGANGTLNITGASAGTVAIAAAASGTLTITGTSAGGLLVQASASGSLTITGKAHGTGPLHMFYGTQGIIGAYYGNKAISRIYVGETIVLSS